MKRLLLGAALGALAALVLGCAPAPAPFPTPAPVPAPAPTLYVLAVAGASFNLPLGQIAHLDGTDFEIVFVEVLGDSRCATGVQCITAGEVTVRLELHEGGTSEEI